jgi:hypothetical protein
MAAKKSKRSKSKRTSYSKGVIKTIARTLSGMDRSELSASEERIASLLESTGSLRENTNGVLSATGKFKGL